MLPLAIAVGSALGGVARYWIATFVTNRFGTTFPLGTVLVNVSGCFIIGLFAGLTGMGGRLTVSHSFRQFFMIGICGGYTTFSSFSLQTLDLARSGDWLLAAINAFGSVAGCFLAVWFGQLLANALTLCH